MIKRKITLFAFYVVGIVLIRYFYEQDLESYRKNNINEQRIYAHQTRDEIQHQISLIYQGLRTIARMPVLKSSRSDELPLDKDSSGSFQEIFNNLNLSIRMSEIYLVPIEFYPDHIDKKTNRPQIPFHTFDELKEARLPSSVKPFSNNPAAEVEIYEYRVMSEQNNWLKENYSKENKVNGFNSPMLSSSEVVTCDNSNFDEKNPDDKRRSGIVFSVPFYDERGVIKGSIAGVVLSDILKSYLPEKYFQISSEFNKYKIGPDPLPNTNFLYQDKLKLNFNDPRATWTLDVSVPESIILNTVEHARVKNAYYIKLIFGTLIALILYRLLVQSEGLVQSQRNALEASAKLASIGEMTSGIAHEINNPLTIIVTKLTMMGAMNEKGTLTKEKISTDVDKLKSTAHRITKIIRGLKSLSRNAEADPFETVSIKKIIDESFEFCTDRLKERKIELRINNEVDCLVSCREVQLSQVVINMVNNSSDAIIDLPEKWISLEVEANQLKNIVSIYITDSGNGIPPEIAKKLMTPFFSTKGVGKGTGLGLSISRKIITEHKGTFELDQNHPNTRFVITLPLVG